MPLILDENILKDFTSAFHASVTFKSGQSKIRLIHRNENNLDVDCHHNVSDDCDAKIDSIWSFSYLGDENKNEEAYFSVLAHFLKAGDHLSFHLVNTNAEIIKIYARVKRYEQDLVTLKNKFTIALDEKKLELLTLS